MSLADLADMVEDDEDFVIRDAATGADITQSWYSSRSLSSVQAMAKSDEPITIKKYANRRLYNTGTSTYVTLEDLATMVKKGEDFVVYDAKTGEDITRSRAGADHLRAGEQGRAEPAADHVPAPAHPLLRRLACRCWCRAIWKSRSTRSSREQEKFRAQMAQAFGVMPFGPLEEQVRRNMEMFERTFAMFAPFARREGQAAAAAESGDAARRPPAAARSTISSARWKRCRSSSNGWAGRKKRSELTQERKLVQFFQQRRAGSENPWAKYRSHSSTDTSAALSPLMSGATEPLL